MAFDFPASPTAGQVFTPPGGPTYVFQTPTWLLQGEAHPIPDDAPADGYTFGRNNNAWVSGGTMHVNVGIQNAHPGIGLVKLDPTKNCFIQGYNGSDVTDVRFGIALVNEEPETGANAGSNFQIFAYDDNGSLPGISVLYVTRATGSAKFGNAVSAFNDSSFGFGFDGANRYIGAGTSTYFIVQGSDGTMAYSYIGANRFWVDGTAANFHVASQAFKPGGGPWTASSDARIKTVNGTYDLGLEEILQLNPVRYTYKGNDTPAPPAAMPKMPDPDNPESEPENTDPVIVPYPNSPHHLVAIEAKEYVGLVAQDVESIFPTMVQQEAGYIDGAPVADIRTLDTNELIYALINSVKTLTARIEALEGAAPVATTTTITRAKKK